MVSKLVAIGSLLAAVVAKPTVLVTGATGATGSMTYARLKKEGLWNTRAFVRNATKAKDILGCDKCDQAEGIYVGDLTEPDTVKAAMADVDVLIVVTAAVAHCTGAIPVGPFGKCSYPKGAYPKDIDWDGTKLQVQTFASTGNISAKHILFVSSGGTTTPDSFLDKIGNGQIGFYKLNAEAYIMNAGVPFTIVKPCGLADTPAEKKKLTVNHDDLGNLAIDHSISRDDVARVLVEAVRDPAVSSGLRFDICSHFWGSATTDIATDVLKASYYPWDPRASSAAPALIV